MTRIKYTPIIGHTYKDWTVISNETFKVESNRATYWKVRCKCGFEGLRNAAHLVNERVTCCKSCAALKQPFEQSYLRRVKERALKSNIEFDITLEDMMSVFTGKCVLSGVDINFGKHWKKLTDQTASLDRIDSTKGYIVGNIQWLHKDINMMKGSLEESKFIELCKLITSKCG